MNRTQVEEISPQVFEFVEFRLGTGFFGISITNVREIIQPVEATRIPHAHPYVKGIIQLRGEVLPVLEFSKMMGKEIMEKDEEAKYIVGEFNDKTVVLEVCAVTQIERVPYVEIEKSSHMYEGGQMPILGVIKKEDGMVLLIDFEKVMIDQFD